MVKSATSDDPVLFHVDPVEELSNTQRKRKGPATRNDFVNDIVNIFVMDRQTELIRLQLMKKKVVLLHATFGAPN